MDMNDNATMRQFGNLNVRLVHGNIADREVDALVNAANHQLQMGGGVAAALRSKGGIEIHQEAIGQAPAAIGSVVRTGAGKLGARFVYHAVVIDYDVSKGTHASDVSAVVKEIAKMAIEDEIDSVAMPLFGAGVGGLRAQDSLEAILDALQESAPRFAKPLELEIVVLEEDTFEEARAAFAEFQDKGSRKAEEDRVAEEFLEGLLGRDG